MVVLEGDFFSPASRDSDATTPLESGNADVDVPLKSNPFNVLPKCKGWRAHKHKHNQTHTRQCFEAKKIWQSGQLATLSSTVFSVLTYLGSDGIWSYLIISDLSKLS